jgi:hypothetical protein
MNAAGGRRCANDRQPSGAEPSASQVAIVLPDEAAHVECVEAWLDRAAKTLAPAQLVTLFERALSALWRRAEVTLGEVTLTAIVDRVLYTASETYPFLSALKVETSGIGFDGFREQGAHVANLPEAVRLVLVEFLTVLGHLTDEILTPALHAELSKVALEGPGAARGHDDGAQGARS